METPMSSRIERFNTTLALLERGSIEYSKRSGLVSSDLSLTAGICVRDELSNCSPRAVVELVLPMEQWPRGHNAHAAISNDLQELWKWRCQDRHIQRMLFCDAPLQLEFDFGAPAR